MVIYLMMIRMREQEHPLVRTVRAYGQSGSSFLVPSETLYLLLGLFFFNFLFFSKFLIHNFYFFLWLTRSPDYWYFIIFSLLKRFDLLVFYLDFNPFTLIVTSFFLWPSTRYDFFYIFRYYHYHSLSLTISTLFLFFLFYFFFSFILFVYLFLFFRHVWLAR